MMIFDAIFQAIALAGCIALIAITEPALNRCHATRTRLCIRLSLLLIGGGALLIMGAILPGFMPSVWPGSAALTCGVALMLFSTKRRTLRP